MNSTTMALMMTAMANMIHNSTGMGGIHNDTMHGNHTMHGNDTVSGGMDRHKGYDGATTMGQGMGGHDQMTTTVHDHGAHAGNTMDHGMHVGMDHGTGHDMPMYFHTGHDEYILFEELRTYMVGHIIAACFVMGAIAVLYEGLKVFREYRRSLEKSASCRYYEGRTMQDPNNKDMSNGTYYAFQSRSCHAKPSVRRNMISWEHILQAFLHMIQVFISYCLMLIFMTFNVWLCLSVVVGAGIGYFLFGWMKDSSVDSNEHCH